MQQLDDLMWLIADEGNAAAIDAFCHRHPEQANELLCRVNMVHQLRAVKPVVPADFVPEFTPKLVSSQGWSSRWLIAIGATTILMATTFGAYSVYTKRQTRETTAVAERELNPTAAHANPAQGSTLDKLPVNQPNYDRNQNLVPTPPKPLPVTLRPFSLTATSLPITAFFNEVTSQTGLKIEIGPGLSDFVVDVSFIQMPALECLRSVATQYGFTVYEETDSSVLIIPAVNPQETPVTTPDGDSREGTPPVTIGAPEGIKPSSSE